jgi:hypothetical protein
MIYMVRVSRRCQQELHKSRVTPVTGLSRLDLCFIRIIRVITLIGESASLYEWLFELLVAFRAIREGYLS